LKQVKTLAPRGFSYDFHKRNSLVHPESLSNRQKTARKTAFGAHLESKTRTADAQVPLHSPVNALHSIEFKAHTISFFSLTQKTEGVKT
jgi:hypothetical protein